MDAKQVQDVIKSARIRYRYRWQRIDRFMEWYQAEWNARRQTINETELGEEQELHFETNYPYAWIDTMCATICPTNPGIKINAALPDDEDVAKHRTKLANDTMRKCKAWKRVKRSSAHAAIAGYGVTKTTWKFKGKNGSPRIESINPRRFIWDDSVDDWGDVAYVAEATLLRKDQFQARARRTKEVDGTVVHHYNQAVAEQAKFGNRPRWVGSDDLFTSDDIEAPPSAIQYVVVWEFYDFTENKYFHLLEDCDEPLFEGDLPYTLARNPYDLIAFNDNLEDSTGISDVHLIANLQERLNEIDTMELNHAQATIPITLFDESATDSPADFISSILNNDGPSGVASLKLKNGKTMAQVFGMTPTPTLSPAWHNMRSRAQQVIEFTLGLPQYMRGGVGEMKIATEGMLADQGLRSRNGARERVLDEWTVSIGYKIIALYAEMQNRGLPIPVWDADGSAQVLDYDDFGFDDEESFEMDWWYRYEAAPESRPENNSAEQLARVQQFAPILMQSPAVDQFKLMKVITELLKLRGIISDQPPAMGPQMAPGQPGAPGLPGLPGSPDPTAGGPQSPDLQGQLQSMLSGTQAARGVSLPPAGV